MDTKNMDTKSFYGKPPIVNRQCLQDAMIEVKNRGESESVVVTGPPAG